MKIRELKKQVQNILCKYSCIQNYCTPQIIFIGKIYKPSTVFNTQIKQEKLKQNTSIQLILQVVPPNSTENATLNDYCDLKIIKLFMTSIISTQQDNLLLLSPADNMMHSQTISGIIPEESQAIQSSNVQLTVTVNQRPSQSSCFKFNLKHT